jgi:YggT family protein
MSLAKVVDVGLTIFYWLILVRAVISWVNPDPLNPIVQILERVTEPILAPIRRLLPPMAIDISPIIAFLIVIFLRYFLVQTLYDLAFRLR